MNDEELRRTSGLAALAVVANRAKRRTVNAANMMLGAFTLKVVAAARDPVPEDSAEDHGDESPCPLRADEPDAELADDAALDLAPERGRRLVHVPRVL